METLTPTRFQMLRVLPRDEKSPLLLNADRQTLWSSNGHLVWPAYGIEAGPDVDLSQDVEAEDFVHSRRMLLVLSPSGTGEVREIVCAEERVRLRPPEAAAPTAGEAPLPASTQWEYGRNVDGTESYVALPGYHVTNRDTDGRLFTFHMVFLAPSFEEARATIDKLLF